MSTAARLSERNNSIQLLSCFNFLTQKTKFPYPIDFKLATLKQLVQSKFNVDSKRKFGFKISRTFVFNKRSVQEMHKLDPQTVEEFVHFMCEHFPSFLHWAEFIKPPQGHSIDYLNGATCRPKSSNLREMFEELRTGFDEYLYKLERCDGKLTIKKIVKKTL